MQVVDEIARKVLQAAEIACAQNAPRPVVAEGFYRAAIALLIAEFGNAVAIETLRDSADRLSDADVNSPIVN